MLLKVLEMVVEVHCYDNDNYPFTDDDNNRPKKVKLNECEELGVEMMARYGHTVR